MIYKRVLSLSSLIILWLQSRSFISGKCLHEFSGPTEKQKLTFQGKELPLTISYGHRASQQATAQLTKILLEEGLGYDDVKLVPCFQETLGTNCGSARFSGVPQAMIDTEVWVPFDREYPAENEVVADVGSIGFTGRLGWFTNSFFVDRMWSEHHQPADHWRALQLRVVLQELPLASELITCQACIENEFHPLQCVQLNQSGENCVALMAAHKGNLSSFMVEDQISSLRLNISVIWLGNNLTSTVLLNEAKRKPLLFYAWDPCPLTTDDKFRRITFPGCSFSSNYIAINHTNKYHGGCDFPLYDLRKFVWKEIQNRYKDIYGLLKAISFTREQITDILHQVGTTQNSALINDSMCHWLNKSRDIWLPWIQAETTAKRTVYIGGMFPSLVEAKAVWSSPGDEVGAQLAIQEINRDKNVLERCRLELLVAPTQCRGELVISAYVRYLNLHHSEKVIGIVGPACSKATLPIAEVARFHNTVLMGYGADDVALSDRTRFPMFFRTNPSIDEFKLAYLSIFREFGWKKCVVLREAKYPVKTIQSRTEFLTKHGVQVLSRELPSGEDLDAKSYVKNVAESKLTVVMLDAYPAVTRAVTCQAYKEGLTSEKGYVWFLLDWLESNWWDVDFYNSKRHAAPESVPCSNDDMKTFVDQGYFTLSSPFFGDDEQLVEGGGTVKQWKERYRSTVTKQKKEWSDYASFANDAVWTYAVALNQLLKNDSSALDKIDTNSTSAKFRRYIQQVDFLGVSGRVHFNKGDRLSDIIIKQKFTSHSVTIGNFIHAHKPNATYSGGLQWNPNTITWASGTIPSDVLPEPEPRALCAVENLRKALGVSCRVAIGIAVLIALISVSVLLIFVIWILKGRYSSKYRNTKNRLRELGLLDSNFTGSIFILDDWEIPREKLVLNRKLGEGAFGAVFGGEGMGLKESEVSVPVAVKTLRVGATIEDKIEFLSEADKMKLLSHPNLVKLLAVCTTGEPVYIVMELMIHGDLKNFLLARRRMVNQPGAPESEDVTPEKLTTMALDIARGLQYLTDMNFVHRDLALRNCMVGFGNVIKIGDFGLARTLQNNDYYRFQRKAMLPVRWMSPESIREGLFTPCTDVWSYGVTLWELSTIGGFPYQGMSNAEVLERVEKGYTLEIPSQSSSEMLVLLGKCWHQDPAQRPKPSEIVKTLLENQELVHACVGVPATTLLDDSMANFDAREANTHVLGEIESLQSNHFLDSDHVSSTLTLTRDARDDHVGRKHSIKSVAGKAKGHSTLPWRKTSVYS